MKQETSPTMHSRTLATERLADELEKPLLDNRSYRVIKLPNQLEALLIHDAEADKASAAMDVNVGSLADPEDMQGTAHAVEHFLFMGTEKYPTENDYSSYLTKFGGHSNAYTAMTSTNYYFELSATSTSNSPGTSARSSETSLPTSKSESPLYGALDRFSQFFVKPLFLADSLDRELRAVDSENKKNLQSDNWRLVQLDRSLSSKQHPYSLFSTGNYKILHDDPIARGVKIRDEFIKFYQKHYSANIMKLAVLGQESLDQLQEWVEELFVDVPNQNLERLRWDGIPIQTEEELGTQIFAKPVMDQRRVDLSFVYPDEEDLWSSRPARYIGHLLGHEGPGSVFAYLKAKGWANGLSAGSYPVCPGAAFFSVDVRLTPDGLASYREVIKSIFQYIAMLKEQPAFEWIAQEQQRLAEVDFTFQQKAPASSTTSRLSHVMQKPYPRDQLLSGQTLIREFNPDAIKRGLDALRPETFRFTLTSQEVPGDWNEKEKWYGTEYKYEKIPAEFRKEIEAAYHATKEQRPKELYLPSKNEFIPQRLDVEKKEGLKPTTSPKLLRNDENLRLWFKKDDTFWVPKASIRIFLRSPLPGNSPFTTGVTQLYSDLVEDSLAEYAYDAELAGLDYNLTRSADGLEISISGYNDKMSVLLEKVLVSMRDLEVKQERFDIMKEKLMRGYRNFDFQEPYRQISTYSRWLSKDRSWATHQVLADMPAITPDDVRSFFPQVLRQMHMEVLVHGNLYKEDALRVADLVEATLKPRALPPSQWKSPRYLALPAGVDHVYKRTLKNADNVNHCIEYMVQVGNAQDRVLRAKLLLFAQIVQEPVFDTLRTKEQLGYIVWSSAAFNGTQAAFRILIQSEKDCEYLENRIDAILFGFEKMIKDMPETEFQAQKVSVINQRLEKLKNLDQESGRLWHHISSEQFDFDLTLRDAEHLEALSKDDVLSLLTTYILPDSPHRAKLSVHLEAASSAEDIAAQLDPPAQRAKLAEVLAPMLAQLGLTADATKLEKSFENVDLSGENAADNVLSAIKTYLVSEAGVAAEVADAFTGQGRTVIAAVLPKAGIEVPKPDVEAANGDVTPRKKNPRVVIEDVKSFKTSLPLSAGPKAVVDLSTFEELEPKL